MKFTDYVLVEQVRALDEQASPDSPLDAIDSVIPNQPRPFAQALLQRAKGLIDEREWGSVISAPAQWYRRLTVLVWLVFAVLGVIAVLNALSGDTSSRVLNIYGLLLVLLGFNLISLLLWLLGCVAKLSGLIRGTVGSLPIGIENLLRRFRQQQARGAYRAWHESHFAGTVGIWRLSLVSHSIWLSYLTAGLVCLLVLFSIRQYDFIWGSTLLSGDAFVGLTRALGGPLHFIGLATPDTSEVLASQSGSITERSMGGSDLRRQWAWFLLGVITLYGLLPRLLAACMSWLALSHAQARYRPDFYLPYYVELKHRLQEYAGHSDVVDADTETRPMPTESASELISRPRGLFASNSLPDGVLIAGFELEATLAEPLSFNITGRDDFAALLQTVASGSQALAVVVDLHAVPDRGTTRKLVQLFAQTKACYLLLLGDVNDATPHLRQRLADWYQLANDAKVPVDHVYRVAKTDLSALVSDR